jgi:hypothetical protein
MRLRRLLSLFAVAPLLTGCACASVPPPASPVPSGDAALSRMRATFQCGNGIQASAKLDHFGSRGRVRGDMLMFAVRPANLRMDVLAPPPLQQPILTLTSDGSNFALADLQQKRFFVGPASTCNIARLTTVPIPAHVLVELLHGEAPVLKHAPGSVNVEWSGKGYYVIRVAGAHNAFEEIHLAPRPDDMSKPWSEQRMRVLDVLVKQEDLVVYHAELEEHSPAAMGKELVDEAGIDPPLAVTGPFCDAEVPRKIHVEVPGQDDDVQFRFESITWNPPVPEGTFRQARPAGLPVTPVRCD